MHKTGGHVRRTCVVNGLRALLQSDLTQLEPSSERAVQMCTSTLCGHANVSTNRADGGEKCVGVCDTRDRRNATAQPRGECDGKRNASAISRVLLMN